MPSCKYKSSIRGRTSRKYPNHIFQRNGNVWLRSGRNKQLYCTCNIYLKNNLQYPQCKYHKNKYPFAYNHKILYEVFHNKKIPKGYQIDHKNQNPKDNRIKNLRLLTKNQNMQNRSSKKNGRSKYKGVTFNKTSKKNPWKARINFNNVQRYLGSFETEAKAYEIYKKEARKLNREKNAKYYIS